MNSTEGNETLAEAQALRKIKSRGLFIVAGGAFRPSSRKGRLLRSAMPQTGDWLPPPAPSGRPGRLRALTISATLF